MNCIFCKIIKGEIPCNKIYEDEKVLAFLDINPVSDGHTLLIPKEHYPMMTDTPNELLAYMSAKAKELMEVIKNTLGAEFVVLSVVGIDVPHFHMHLIPRYKNDDLKEWPTKKYAEGEAEKIIERIKLFGS